MRQWWRRRSDPLSRVPRPADDERGILLEVRDGHGIVLTPSGQFRRVSLPWTDARVGDEIPLAGLRQSARPARAAGWMRRLGRLPLRPAAALGMAALLLVLAPLGVVLTTRQLASAPLAFITVDINPSVELAINGAGRVTGADALNDDGSRVLAHLGDGALRGLEAEAAVVKVAEAAVALRFLTQGADHLILISLTPASPAAGAGLLHGRLERLQGRLDAAAAPLEAALRQANVPAAVETLAVGPEVREEAKAMRVSPGRLAVVLAALAGEGDAPAAVGPQGPALMALEDNLLAGLEAAGKNPVAVLAQAKEKGGQPKAQAALVRAEQNLLKELTRSLEERRGSKGGRPGSELPEAAGTPDVTAGGGSSDDGIGEAPEPAGAGESARAAGSGGRDAGAGISPGAGRGKGNEEPVPAGDGEAPAGDEADAATGDRGPAEQASDPADAATESADRGRGRGQGPPKNDRPPGHGPDKQPGKGKSKSDQGDDSGAVPQPDLPVVTHAARGPF